MVQIVEQTHDEKVEMYKKCTKLELIEMLIISNLNLEAVTKQLNKLSVMQGGVLSSQSVQAASGGLTTVTYAKPPSTPTEQ